MFARLTYSSFFADYDFEIWFMPFTLSAWVIFCFFRIIFSKRIKKSDDINNINKGFYGTKYYHIFFIIFIFLCIVYSLAFFVPYFLTIYFFQLFVMIKIKRQKNEDLANNILRY